MIYLARHGRTAANAGGLLLGRADVELDDVGRVQAQSLPARIPSAARVVSSPLRRCVATAESFGLPVEIDDRWIELDYGEFDQRPIGEVPADVWDRWRGDPSFAPPGGESLTALGTRVRAALDELAAGQAGPDAPDVVVVTHVSPIKAGVAWALGVGDEVAWRMFVAVGSVSRIAVGPRGPTLQAFNAVPNG